MVKSLRCLVLIGFVFAIFYLGLSHVLAWSADGAIHHLAQSVLFEMRRSDALHRRQMEMAEVMKIKQAATTEFLAGRLTLREAAKQFRAADAIVQDDSEGLVAAYITPGTEQGVCQQVEVWVQRALSEGHTSQKVEEVRGRLEKEQNQLLRSTEHRVN